MVECLEAPNRVAVCVFGQILDPEFENDISKFEETFMGATRTHNLWMTLKVHMLVNHVPENVRHTEFHSGLPLSRRWRFSIDFLIVSATDSK